MSTISVRVLELLALLQNRRHWGGEELARRLEVSPRTLRRDVRSLQDLGYPITTVRGTGGGYQLAPGGSLPPLVLGEDEAATVVLALKDAATGAYPADPSAAVTALAKIVQVLPAKIRRRIDSLQHLATLPGPFGHAAAVDTGVLTALALAARDHEVVALDYTDVSGNRTHRTVQPHVVVSLHQRLYLVAFDLMASDWRTLRIDRAADPERTGQTFAPRKLPTADAAEYVRQGIESARTVYEVTASAECSADAARERLGEWGAADPIDAENCIVRISVSNLDWANFALAALDVPFIVHSPEEAIDHAAAWGARLTRAANRR
ncbi:MULTISPECIES: YafY family protein [Brevibacterium]|nr:YafY family protein [Brevibacterium sp. W7.2]